MSLLIAGGESLLQQAGTAKRVIRALWKPLFPKANLLSIFLSR